jgi:deoxyribonuclease-1
MMYRKSSFAVALLATAFSGHALADGINNFSQAKDFATSALSG